MDDYILRKDALKALKIARGYCPCAYSDISAFPAADVAPVVHGKWDDKGYVCGETAWECSVCHEIEWRTSCGRLKYCPFCGAKMDGGDEDAKAD